MVGIQPGVKPGRAATKMPFPDGEARPWPKPSVIESNPRFYRIIFTDVTSVIADIEPREDRRLQRGLGGGLRRRGARKKKKDRRKTWRETGTLTRISETLGKATAKSYAEGQGEAICMPN